MHLGIKSYLETMIQRHSFSEPILDTAAGWEPNMYQPLFVGKRYLKQDIRDFEPACIDYICDICDMAPIKSESIGLVLNLEALERIYNPQKAVDEIYRILKPGGLLILTTYMYYPFRSPSDPNRFGQHDFWRFTPEGLLYLLKQFRILNFTIEGAGRRFRGLLICGRKSGSTSQAQNRPVKPKIVPLGFVFPETKGAEELERANQKRSLIDRGKYYLVKKLWQSGDWF